MIVTIAIMYLEYNIGFIATEIITPNKIVKWKITKERPSSILLFSLCLMKLLYMDMIVRIKTTIASKIESLGIHVISEKGAR